jgi:hypothetical protein
MMRSTAFLLTAALIPTWAWAVNLVIETQPGAAGQTTTVRLLAAAAPELGYLNLELAYDWEQLKLLEIQPSARFMQEGVAMAAYPEALPDSSGLFRFAVVAPGGMAGMIELVDLVFAIGDSVREDARIELRSARAVGMGLQEVAVVLGDGGRATITAIQREQQRPPPQTPALLPNRPNPFNASTLIPFQLAQRADVELEIHNVLGQMVRRFELGEMAAGYYQGVSSVHWDGRDSRGRHVASGVYIIRLRAGEFVQIQKALLLR